MRLAFKMTRKELISQFCKVSTHQSFQYQLESIQIDYNFRKTSSLDYPAVKELCTSKMIVDVWMKDCAIKEVM